MTTPPCWTTVDALVPFLSDAYDSAKMLCEKYYLAAPKLKIEEFNSKISFISPSAQLQ